MKIKHAGKWYVLSDYRVKGCTLGMLHSEEVSCVGVRSSQLPSNVILNLMSLYLDGDYLEGGRL